MDVRRRKGRDRHAANPHIILEVTPCGGDEFPIPELICTDTDHELANGIGDTGQKTAHRMYGKGHPAHHIAQVVGRITPNHLLIGRLEGRTGLRIAQYRAIERRAQAINDGITLLIDCGVIEGYRFVDTDIDRGPLLENRAGVACGQRILGNIGAERGPGTVGTDNVEDRLVAATSLVGQGIPTRRGRQGHHGTIGSGVHTGIGGQDETLTGQYRLQGIVRDERDQQIGDQTTGCVENTHRSRVIEERYPVVAIPEDREYDLILLVAQTTIVHFAPDNVRSTRLNAKMKDTKGPSRPDPRRFHVPLLDDG